MGAAHHWLALAVLAAWGLMVLVLLGGCAGLDTQQQRVVSGAAIGGTLAGPIGAGVGAMGGWIVDKASSRPGEDAR